MSQQNNMAINESSLLNVEYLPSSSYRSDTSKGIEVHKAILAIQKEIIDLGGIAKSSTNESQKYKYRSIGDIQAVLTPMLVKHGVTCIGSTERSNISQFYNKRELCIKALVQIRYVFTSIIDGSIFEIVMIGEANDYGDKAIIKAHTCAQKNMYNQVFSIPTGEDEKQGNHSDNTNQRNYRNSNNHQPNWSVNEKRAPKSQNNQQNALASPELKRHVAKKLANWGYDLNSTINQIGLNIDTVTDLQLRNIFEEIRGSLKASTQQSIQ